MECKIFILEEFPEPQQTTLFNLMTQQVDLSTYESWNHQIEKK